MAPRRRAARAAALLAELGTRVRRAGAPVRALARHPEAALSRAWPGIRRVPRATCARPVVAGARANSEPAPPASVLPASAPPAVRRASCAPRAPAARRCGRRMQRRYASLLANALGARPAARREPSVRLDGLCSLPADRAVLLRSAHSQAHAPPRSPRPVVFAVQALRCQRCARHAASATPAAAPAGRTLSGPHRRSAISRGRAGTGHDGTASRARSSVRAASAILATDAAAGAASSARAPACGDCATRGASCVSDCTARPAVRDGAAGAPCVCARVRVG